MVGAILATICVSTLVAASPTQIPLQHQSGEVNDRSVKRKLHGRFLHITDLHPDSNYAPGSNPGTKCHRGTGESGILGTEKSSCDSPWSLINETFHWIDNNLKDQVDFVIWTGDSARHDNDVKIPRTVHEIYENNKNAVEKMLEVFGGPVRSEDKYVSTIIPIIPTIGNNDIFPHNIMFPGPSALTKEYVELWKHFIPEDQYHVFHKGGYFWQQVVPAVGVDVGMGTKGGLAVFSLNTMYFFDSNTAVDGCDIESEPGYEQMEWLKVQLELMREREMKAILIGHVPPAWTSAKRSWDETCWKKYVKWSKQFRDVIVGHLYGHMNLDHFMLLDTVNENHDKKKKGKKGEKGKRGKYKTSNTHAFSKLRDVAICLQLEEFDPEVDPKMTIESAGTYLHSLRESFDEIPAPKSESSSGFDEAGQLGGKWAERYAVTLVSPSIVPNYFPTLRVIEYNISGLVDSEGFPRKQVGLGENLSEKEMVFGMKHDMKQQDKIEPNGPSITTPPGPAYSAQPYTFISYTQYFLNLTKYNAILKENSNPHNELKRDLESKIAIPTSNVEFEVEYDTKTDKMYRLDDLTVRSFVKLARRIADAPHNEPKRGKRNHKKNSEIVDMLQDQEETFLADSIDFGDDSDFDREKKKKKSKKHQKRVWHEFVARAFVGTLEKKELEKFDQRGFCEGSFFFF